MMSRAEEGTSPEAKKMSRAEKGFRLFVGTLLSPFDSLLGFFKGLVWWAKATYNTFEWRRPKTWLKAPFAYFYARFNVSSEEVSKIKNPNRDTKAKAVSGMYTLSHIGGVCLTVLCVLGFAGLLAFPGTAPLTLAFLPILKAVGITVAWSTAGRLLGALIGSIGDTLKMKSICKTDNKGKNNKHEKREIPPQVQKMSSYRYWAKKGLLLGCFGEAAPFKNPTKLPPAGPGQSESSARASSIGQFATTVASQDSSQSSLDVSPNSSKRNNSGR